VIRVEPPVISDTVQRIESLCDSAVLYCLVDYRQSGSFHNVNTSIIRTNRREISSLTTADSVRCVSRSGARSFIAHRILISKDEANEFFSAAIERNAATLPGIGDVVRFAPCDVHEAFLPLQGPSDNCALSPLTVPAYTRRAWARDKKVGSIPFDESNIARIVDTLPKIIDTRFTPLSLDSRLDSIGDVEDLYPVGITLDVRQVGNELKLSLLADPHWREAFPELVISGSIGKGVLQRSHISISLPSTETGAVIVDPAADAFSLTLAAIGGELLDFQQGHILRRLAVNAYVVDQQLRITMDSAGNTVDIDLSKDSTAMRTMSGAAPDASGQIVAHWFLGNRWKRDAADRISETLLDPAGSAAPTDIYERLVRVVRAVSGSSAPVRIVDPYLIDEAALTRITLVAAAARASHLQLLTNLGPIPGAPIFDFQAALKKIAKIARVRIEVFQPSFSVHDRFLWVGDRIWHFGHSFNSYGSHSLSAVGEMRNLEVVARLRDLLEIEFGRSPSMVAP